MPTVKKWTFVQFIAVRKVLRAIPRFVNRIDQINTASMAPDLPYAGPYKVLMTHPARNITGIAMQYAINAMKLYSFCNLS